MSTGRAKPPAPRGRVHRMAFRHGRFLAAFGIGCGVTALSLAAPLGPEVRALVGVNAFFLVYLAQMLGLVLRWTPDHIRAKADAADEGLALILTLAGLTVVTSLTAIFIMVNQKIGHPAGAVLAVSAVLLGWGMVQTLAAFHYAHLFYEPADDPATPQARDDAGGLIFPHTAEPGLWDFLYFGFTVGMTAQVSDVLVTGTAMRRVVLAHGIWSFFHNTVILALAVNAALVLGRV